MIMHIEDKLTTAIQQIQAIKETTLSEVYDHIRTPEEKAMDCDLEVKDFIERLGGLHIYNLYIELAYLQVPLFIKDR